MADRLRYVVFGTRWGKFGLLGGESGVFRSCLPVCSRQAVEGCLLAGVEEAGYDEGLFVGVQEKVKAYFDGSYVDFGDVEVVLSMSEFGRRVLGACRDVRYGQCVSYGDLAKMAGRARAVRAVGGALGRNPVPLIIGCHRIVRSDGKIGGFSAGGGVGLKQRMIELESK